jgi:hypothetical protein
VLEVGARTIHEFRAHPKRKPWEMLPVDERQAFVDQMQRIVDGLRAAGYVFVQRESAE